MMSGLLFLRWLDAGVDWDFDNKMHHRPYKILECAELPEGRSVGRFILFWFQIMWRLTSKAVQSEYSESVASIWSAEPFS